MTRCPRACVRRTLGPLVLALLAGCSSPLDATDDRSATDPARPRTTDSATRPGGTTVPFSRYRDDEERGGHVVTAAHDETPGDLDAGASADDAVALALHRSPRVEAAYQRWRAAAARLPQAGALPDPHLTAGVFVNEIETRTGPQQGRLGLRQAVPWPGTLAGRRDAASRSALAAWRRYESVRLDVAADVRTAVHELAHLDASIAIAASTLELVRSFEDVVRARYRVGAGSHPELVRAQVELGRIEDRLRRLEALRPALAAELNALLDRDASAALPAFDELAARRADAVPADLAAEARRSNRELLALDEESEARREEADLARLDGRPDLVFGVDWILVGDAADPSITESGDDAFLLSVGVSLPLWRERYDAGVREALAGRLAVARERDAAGDRIAAAIERRWFEHVDADRRVRLYDRTLVPKAETGLRATLAAYRAADARFLDLLDAERTLLEFRLVAARARADRAIALAELERLVGTPIATVPADAATRGDTDAGARTVPDPEPRP